MRGGPDRAAILNRLFVGEKPAWCEICDAAKQFEGHPAPA